MSPDSREPTTEGYGTYETTRQAASYVTEILENEARHQAKARVSPKRRRRGIRAFAFSAPIFAVLTVINVAAANRSVPPLEPVAAKHEAQVGIYLAIQQIEAYKDANDGRLPPTLEDVGADAPGLVFVRDAQGYEIVAELDGTYERYRHGDDPSRFEEAASALFVNERGGS